jgi:hypothetical protein
MKIGVHDDYEGTDSRTVAYMHVLIRRDGRAAADRDVISDLEYGTWSGDKMRWNRARCQKKTMAQANLPVIGSDGWPASEMRFLANQRTCPQPAACACGIPPD